jgi:hypothetical protein
MSKQKIKPKEDGGIVFEITTDSGDIYQLGLRIHDDATFGVKCVTPDGKSKSGKIDLSKFETQ